MTMANTQEVTVLRLNVTALEAAMRRKRINIANLSIATGLHRNTLYNLLNGTSQPSLETVSKLAQMLETNPFALLEDVETDAERTDREKREARTAKVNRYSLGQRYKALPDQG